MPYVIPPQTPIVTHRVYIAANDDDPNKVFTLPRVKVGLVADVYAHLVGEELNTGNRWVFPVRDNLNEYYKRKEMPQITSTTVRDHIHSGMYVNRLIDPLKERIQELTVGIERGVLTGHDRIAMRRAISLVYNRPELAGEESDTTEAVQDPEEDAEEDAEDDEDDEDATEEDPEGREEADAGRVHEEHRPAGEVQEIIDLLTPPQTPEKNSQTLDKNSQTPQQQIAVQNVVNNTVNNFTYNFHAPFYFGNNSSRGTQNRE